jgi:hypothetical protein
LVHSEIENKAAEVRKVLFVEKRRGEQRREMTQTMYAHMTREETGCMGAFSRTQKSVVPWVRLETGFLSPFFVLPKGGDVFQLQTEGSWEEVSPWSVITFWDLLQSVLQLVHERAGNTLETIGIGKDFLSRTPAAQQLRERMDKWDYMKLKSFNTTKEMVSKLKRSPWEKIFASYTSDKGLITRIYIELKKLNSPKINEPIKKWATELNRTFSKAKWP